jgi:hypothetical protein
MNTAWMYIFFFGNQTPYVGAPPIAVQWSAVVPLQSQFSSVVPIPAQWSETR